MTFNQLKALKKIMFLGLVVLSLSSQAQQLYYSQYQLTPMLNNPSLVSLTEELKIDVGYRNQFGGKGSNYSTPVVSAQMPFYQEVGRDLFKKFGAGGIQILTDRTGFSGILATTGFSLTYAHIAHLSKTDWISFGIQPGLYQRRVDFSKLNSGSQWDDFQGSFDQSLDINENIQNTERKTFFTINTGATYVREDSRGNPFLVLSVAANNLTQPNVSLNTKSFSNPINWNVQGSLVAYENQQAIIKPTIRHIQARNLNQTNIGSYFYYKVADKMGFIGKGTVGLGLWYSTRNAVVTALEINQKDWALGFSYDFLASTLADANNSMGAPEFIIGFRKYIGKVKKGSSDINASGEPGLGGSGGGKLKDPKKVTPPPTEITPEPEAKPEDGKEGKENKPAVDPTVTEKKVDQPLVEAKPKEVEKPAAEPTKPKDKDAKAGSKKAGKKGSKKSAASNSSGSRKAVKSGLRSNLSPEMLAKLSKVVTSDEDLGEDPYKGTALALTKKQKDVFKKQPRYGKGGIEIDDLTKAQLSKVAKIMKSRPKLKLEVNGFTCDLGTKEGNEMISKARAENVKKYLISKGVPASRVETKGNAFEKPIVNNTSEEARQTNRRVQFRFIP